MMLVYGAGEDFHEFTFHNEPQNSYVDTELLKLALSTIISLTWLKNTGLKNIARVSTNTSGLGCNLDIQYSLVPVGSSVAYDASTPDPVIDT